MAIHLVRKTGFGEIVTAEVSMSTLGKDTIRALTVISSLTVVALLPGLGRMVSRPRSRMSLE